jgi:fatty-acyl-CoA synthase
MTRPEASASGRCGSSDAKNSPVTKSSVAKSSVAKTWLKAIEKVSRIEREPRRLLADMAQERAWRHPDRPALLSDDGCFTYGEFANRVNRYARVARLLDIGRGCTVGLLMPNRPDYLACWIGISSVGGTVALLNTSLVGRSLAHCIDVARPDHLVLATECEQAFESGRRHLECVPRVWRLGSPGTSEDLDAALATVDGGPLTPAERGGVAIDDRALLIYTSGTTGLPKAANVSHRRVLGWSAWFAGMTEASEVDRLYDCLPLHHSVGGVVAPCSMLHAGGSAVVARKFSAGRFWDDIVRFDCTAFQYIGELCRYLLKAPFSEAETRHSLRLAVGNGLRSDVWNAFVRRFAIPRILEFYAATEGNFSLFNVEGEPGAVGRVPAPLAHRFPAALVKVDDDGAPVRGADGLCIACASGEIGEAIGRIGTAARGGGIFEGYTDRAETGKKILKDVFARDDAWVRTGDLMILDRHGFFRFVDRIGDTFRWKGENVATGEVDDAARDCPGVVDAATYGVSIPGADGRAGMTALVIGPDFDLAAFAAHLTGRLPVYAHPVFVRFCKAIESTETFRRKKRDLAADGFDPSAIDDRLFQRDPATGSYRPLDAAGYGRIVEGGIRL